MEGLKIGIISDTHDNLEKTEEAIELFEENGCDMVIHCGDMVAPFTAELFDRGFEFHAVRGNNDGEWSLQDTVEEFGNFMGQQGELEIEGEKFGVYHGTKEPIARSMVESGRYDYVLRGHTHEKKLEGVGGTVEINPGGIKFPEGSEKLHVAMLQLENGEIEFHRIDK